MKHHWQHWRVNRALSAMFCSTMSEPLSPAMMEHLRRCPACQKRYRELSWAERALAEEVGADVALAPIEVEATWNQLAHALAPASSIQPQRGWRRAGLAAAVGVLVATVWHGATDTPSNPAFAPRGHGAPTFRLYCLEGTTHQPRTAHRGPDGAADCNLDSVLGFGYTNPDGAYRFLSVFATDASGAYYWYAPNPAQPESLAIPPSDGVQALPRTVRLSVNHDVGTFRVMAVFTVDPLPFDALQTHASTFREKNRDMSTYVVDSVLNVHHQ